jgi:uncharacterized membrane protein
MINKTAIAGVTTGSPVSMVRKIGVADLKDALASGLDDFKAMPSHAVFLCIIYPIVAFFLGKLTVEANVLPLFFPLAAGFALIGPFAAIGLYELSRRRENGQDVSFRHAFDILRSPSIGSIAAVGIALMAIFIAWLEAAQRIYVLTFGQATPESIADFARQIFTTQAGWTLIIAGNGVGFLFAVLALTISVVSSPLLLDRNVGAIAAMQMSIRVVLANPGTMAVWGLIVAGSLVIGSLPFFVGLAVVMPVLGHSTWHLYRKVLER